MSNTKNRNLYIILGVATLLALVAIFVSGKREKGITVYTTKVKKRDIQETVLASGKIYPKTEVKISSDVSGEIVELYVKEGDTIKANQLLARINPDAYASAVERGRANVNSAKAQEANSRAQAEGAKARKIQAEAQLEQIMAQLRNAKSIFERNKSLLKNGVISQADFDAAESAYLSTLANKKSAEASVAAATASYNSSLESIKAAGFNVNNAIAGLKEMNTSLQRTSIFAPMAGILSKLSVEKGERVVGTIQMAGTEMMRISDFSVMESQVDVSETNILQVNLGNKAVIEIDAYPDRKFTGKVTEIGNSASNLNAIQVNSDQVTNFTVKIVVDPSSYQDLIKPGLPFPLRPGMSSSVEIFTKESNDILAVPIQSVTTREKDEKDNSLKNDEKIEVVVFKISGDTVSQQVVKTGIQDDEYIEIISGLQENDEVVKGPYNTIVRKLENGSKIKVKDEKKSKRKKRK